MKYRTLAEHQEYVKSVLKSEKDGKISYNKNRFTYERGDKKIGRNELCPCGSGKKYKKCCLIKHSN